MILALAIAAALSAADGRSTSFEELPPGAFTTLDSPLGQWRAAPGAAARMRVARCTALQPVLPVLVGNEQNPVARLELEVEGDLAPLRVTGIGVDLEGTSDLTDLARVELFHGGDRRALDHRRPDAVFEAAARFGGARSPAEGELWFEDERPLTPGLETFWVSVTPTATADLDHLVEARVTRVELSNGTRLVPEAAPSEGRRRIGVALRDAGDDGAAVYRIPGLTTTPAGTLIAVYDVRWKGWRDLPADIDVGMSRSADGGRTWEPMRLVMDMGEGSEEGAHHGDGVGDPSVLVDRETGAVFVAAIWSHGDRGWHGSGPGLTPEETGQWMLVRSDDDGRSWSAPRSLTPEIKDPEWAFLLAGPGRGITMGDGTLVFPAQFQAAPEAGRTPHATVVWSDDHGASWRIGTGAKPDTTEAAVVELGDGELMLNMRDNRGGARSVHVSDDLGRSWAAHPTTRGALPEPVCMASLVHVGRELDGAPDGRLLFSNPAVDRAPRRRMTIQASDDGGRTWPAARRVLLDEGSSAGYSCLTMIDADTVGILFESSRAHLAFLRVPLAELE